MEVVSE